MEGDPNEESHSYGLEGPPDLTSSDSLPPVDEAHSRTYTLTYTETQGIRSHQPTHRYFLLCLMVERAGGLVSVMCFPQGAFGCHSEAVLFSVTLHVAAAPSPRAAFFFYLQVRSPLCPLVLSSMQFYSVSSPLSSLNIAAPLPTHTLTCLLHDR